MRRTSIALALGAWALGGLVANGGWTLAQEQPDRENRATEAQTETQRDEQRDEQRAAQQREEERRLRQQREERQRDERSRDQQEQRFQDQRSQDQRFEDQRSQDPRFQDQRFQDQRQPDRQSLSRQPSDDRRQRGDLQQESGAWLGVYLADSQQGQQQGALVRSIYPTGPAARAGFRQGDVIVSIDGQRVSDPNAVTQALERMQAGAQTQFVVLRNNQEVPLTVRLGDRQQFLSMQRGDFFRQGQQGSGQEEDDFASIPPHLMELEHHRRMAEQHQRLEEMLQQLQQEVRELRQELRSARR